MAREVGRVRIGELARAVGTTARALRHYEQAGLISSERAPNGYRVYDEQAAVRVRNIRYLLAAGLTLDDVRVFLPCLDGDVAAAPPSGKGLRVALERLAILNERIAVQTEARDRLEAALREKTGDRIRPVA
ncbi:MerR-family transcriptional regulator [Streptomyces pristinaespiralis ATCC 25486]|uniref:MerR-family transcriptional regulator n=1 Tax=Streptomyces pristinaespiralis (strain ATCC 25486 / DSM 40338 / CBS 914.69 / JCM 4507 / KCC S-0507 / NBRC 13074 / NRRL 2958 / 5647) TaxID=457429 RepID=B5HI31_STRE2|nr:MerR-family transcriptional regulator [Streptomyces pristinaespiralis ATCC 25486]